VRFHIVYFPGVEVPGLIQIPLHRQLSDDPCFSFDVIDSAAYPYSIPSGSFPLRNMDPDFKTRLLEHAGTDRLRSKAERLAIALQNTDAEQVLWEELMAALGYKNNKRPFRLLALHIPLNRLRCMAQSPNEAYAVLLGMSGLLPIKISTAWPADTRRFIRTLWDFWWKQPEELHALTLMKTEWNLAGQRPANHPVRRLMAAAHYVFRIPELATDERLLTAFPENFWNTHISWKRTCKPTALVGYARANAIITNLLVPWRAATGAIEQNLGKLPVEPVNNIIRQTAHTLFGPDHSPGTYQSALARQGLIHIFHNFLITHRLNEIKTAYADVME